MARKHKLKYGFMRKGGLRKCDYQDDVDYLSMSAEEVRAHFDAIEPIDQAEVDESFQRLFPKIMDKALEVERKREPRRASVRIRRGIVFAICLILMLSAVAQALGIPVWSTVVEWTKEHLVLKITSSGDTPSEDEPKVYHQK